MTTKHTPLLMLIKWFSIGFPNGELNTNNQLSQGFQIDFHKNSTICSTLNLKADSLRIKKSNIRFKFEYSETTIAIKHETKAANYENAAQEIEQMLKGSQVKSFKRAVYLVENAFYNGQLEYQKFDTQIKEAADKIKLLAATKGSTQVALHWAIFSYLTQSIEQNQYSPCKYDIDGLFAETPKSHRINFLLSNKLGNCHSLPFLYQILAEEVGADSHIARAPMHYYIKHQDDKGKWWNLELTSASYSRTSFIVESFKISDEAIRSGLYMKPLSKVEELVLCVEDLINDYLRKYNSINDGYVSKLVKLGLQYNPTSEIEQYVGIEQSYYYSKKCKELGLPEHGTHPSKHPDLEEIAHKIDESDRKLASYGFTKITPQQYGEMVKKSLSNPK